MAINPYSEPTVASSIVEQNRPKPFSSNSQAKKPEQSDTSPKLIQPNIPEASAPEFDSSPEFHSSYDSFISSFNSSFNKQKEKDDESQQASLDNNYYSIPDHYDQYTYSPNSNNGVSESDQHYSGSPGSLQNLVDKHEGGGQYTTLFGHAEKSGPLAGTDITKMTIGQLANFASSNGTYGQYQKGKIGYLATPMGRYQIVGSTLQSTANALGLSPDTLFDKKTQDMMFNYLVDSRIGGDKSIGQKISNLRSEWDSFKHVSDSDLANAIHNYQNGSSKPIEPVSEAFSYSPVETTTPTPKFTPQAPIAQNQQTESNNTISTPNGFATIKKDSTPLNNPKTGFIQALNDRSNLLGNQNKDYFGDRNSHYVSQDALDSVEDDYNQNRNPRGFF